MRVTLPSGTPAELALPEGDPVVGLALAPDIGGLRPLFDDLCARLARERSWAVCAPEPFPGREQVPVEERLSTPLDALRRPEACPALALLGGRDTWTPVADVDALRGMREVEVVVYPDAEHGFVHDATRPAHRAGDAADAWSRAYAFVDA